MPKSNKLEKQFLEAWRLYGIEDSDPQPQYKCGIKSDANREYVFDFAWPKCRILIEIQGAGFGHVTIKARERDATKARRAMAAGWTVITVTSACINTQNKCREVCSEIVSIVERHATWGE